MRHLLALVMCSLISTTAFAESWREARVRPQDPRLVTLLRQGVERSPTLRALVDRIEASNVFVYIGLSPLMKSNLAGKLTWMTRSGDYRYLRATINTEQNADQMIATLAHELQHVVEVIEEELVSDQRSLQELYKRIGRPSISGVGAGWETEAAQQTGLRVRRELVAATANTAVARTTTFMES
jgi:predicted transcriptional regulator